MLLGTTHVKAKARMIDPKSMVQSVQEKQARLDVVRCKEGRRYSKSVSAFLIGKHFAASVKSII